jgi:hypothetical protein
MEGVPTRIQQIVDATQIGVGLLRPMTPAAMKCIVVEAVRTLENVSYYTRNRDTRDLTSDIPAGVGQAVGILVEIDPVDGVLYYTPGTVFSSDIDLKAAFSFLVRSSSAKRFVCGWIKLYYGQTAIMQSDILPHQELITKGGSASANAIVTYRGQVVTYNGDIVTWSVG